MIVNSGAEAAPWLAMMVVDIGFAAVSIIKLFGPGLFAGDEDDEPLIDQNDVNVPDAWFYGLFGLNLLGNCGWHGYQAVMQTNFTSFYNSIWFLVEIFALVLTYLFFKHAQAVARKAARELRATQKAAAAAAAGGPRAVA